MQQNLKTLNNIILFYYWWQCQSNIYAKLCYVLVKIKNILIDENVRNHVPRSKCILCRIMCRTTGYGNYKIKIRFPTDYCKIDTFNV